MTEGVGDIDIGASIDQNPHDFAVAIESSTVKGRVPQSVLLINVGARLDKEAD